MKQLLIIFSSLCIALMGIYARNTIADKGSTPNSSKHILSKEFRILHNELYVQNLDLMREFYVDGLGFQIIGSGGDVLELGWGDEIHLILKKQNNYTARNPRGAGLYHIAYVHPTRSALTNRLAQVLSRYPDLYEGSADHLVSEAFYMHDPEGNGVELYFDKDPSTWIRSGGRVKMDSLYIDVMNYIKTYTASGDNEFVVGHNHLQVGDLEKARWFYHEVLGFDITADDPGRGALFVSAAGYHHHFGLNIWNSNGAGVRPEEEYGLGRISMELAQDGDLDRLAARLDTNSWTYTKDNQTLTTRDPWGNILEFVVR